MPEPNTLKRQHVKSKKMFLMNYYDCLEFMNFKVTLSVIVPNISNSFS